MGNEVVMFEYDKAGKVCVEAVKYKELLALVTFGQTMFMDENFVVNAQLEPHRKLRQCLMEFDNKVQAYALNQTVTRRVDALLELTESELRRLRKLRGRIATGTGASLTAVSKMPAISFKVILGSIESAHTVTFDPAKIAAFYTLPEEAADYKKDLLEELARIIGLREVEFAEAAHNQIKQEKLMDDCKVALEFYAKKITEIAPEVEKLEKEGVNAEEAEKQYWIKRLGGDAHAMIISRGTGIDRGHVQSIAQLPKDIRDAVLLEVVKANQTASLRGDLRNAFDLLGVPEPGAPLPGIAGPPPEGQQSVEGPELIGAPAEPLAVAHTG